MQWIDAGAAALGRGEQAIAGVNFVGGDGRVVVTVAGLDRRNEWIVWDMAGGGSGRGEPAFPGVTFKSEAAAKRAAEAFAESAWVALALAGARRLGKVAAWSYGAAASLALRLGGLPE